jgi:hypothetical protein
MLEALTVIAMADVLGDASIVVVVVVVFALMWLTVELLERV